MEMWYSWRSDPFMSQNVLQQLKFQVKKSKCKKGKSSPEAVRSVKSNFQTCTHGRCAQNPRLGPFKFHFLAGISDFPVCQNPPLACNHRLKTSHCVGHCSECWLCRSFAEAPSDIYHHKSAGGDEGARPGPTCPAAEQIKVLWKATLCCPRGEK